MQIKYHMAKRQIRTIGSNDVILYALFLFPLSQHYFLPTVSDPVNFFEQKKERKRYNCDFILSFHSMCQARKEVAEIAGVFVASSALANLLIANTKPGM